MDLKPCPFCGETPSLVRWGNEWDVECISNDCLIVPETGLFKTKIEAIEAWNRRVGEWKKED